MIKVVWYHETAHLEGQDVHGNKFSVKARDVSGFRRTAKGCLIVPDDGPMYEADTTYGEVRAAYLEAKTARRLLCDFTASEFKDIGLDEDTIETCLREWAPDIHDKMRIWVYDLIRSKLRDELGDPGTAGAVANDSPSLLHSPSGGHLYGGEEDGA